MQPSAKCAAFIKGFEQCRLKAYMPTSKDKPTIGWGTTGHDIKLGMVWTQLQADTRFNSDLAKFGQGVEALLKKPSTQGQYDALVSLAYNIGVDALRTSSLLRAHNVGDFATASRKFLDWDHQDGEVLAGLTRRRTSERAMYDGH